MTGFKWTLKTLFVLTAIVAVHLALIRIPPALTLVGLGWSIAAAVATKRCGLHPCAAAMAAVVASTAATSIFLAAVVAQTAFAPPPSDTALMWGGGWSTVVMAGIIGGIWGVIMGLIVAMGCLAAFLPTWSADREAFAVQRSLSRRESD